MRDTATPRMTTTAPTGSYKVSFSPSTMTPSTVEWLQFDDAARVGQRDRAPVAPVDKVFHARDSALTKIGEQRPGVERGALVQPQRESAAAWRLRPVPAQLRRIATERGAHRLVKLADAGESRRPRDRRQGQTRLVDEQASRLGAAGARQGERADTHLGHQRAMQVALAYLQATGKAGDAPLVRRALGDQAQRPPGRSARRFHSGESGAFSGWQRRQARNPAASAAAAWL